MPVRNGSPVNKATRKRIHSAQKGACAACHKGMKYRDMTLHHVTPRRDGGRNQDENLIGCHRACHDELDRM